MTLLFFSDPHIGVHRVANTTAASRLLLKTKVVEALDNVLNNSEWNGLYKICLGDFFDTYSNSEADILEAMRLFKPIDLCLAGNHDVVADTSKNGSLDVLNSVYSSPKRISRAAVGETEMFITHYGDTNLVSVPHHSDQTAFEQALQRVYNYVASIEPGIFPNSSFPNILLLHCNYNLTEAMCNDTALNLTEEDAKTLLEVFDYILIGHDHTPKSYFNGRLLVVGNLMPTSFSDISDKRVLTFDSETKKMESHLVWQEATGYLELQAANLLSDKVEIPKSVQFIRIVGKLPSANVGELSKAISRIWKSSEGTLLALKNAVEIEGANHSVNHGLVTATIESIPQRLDAALKDTDMYTLWNELYGDTLHA